MADSSPSGAEAPDELAALRDRVALLESRLALIDRKFDLLGAKTERELVGGDELFLDPAMLQSLAETQIPKREWELGYRYMAVLRSLHPESPEALAGFPMAAGLFRRAYFRNRLTRPESVWMTTEPVFMFHWLEGYFDGSFPQEQASALLVGMPYDFFLRYVDWARHRSEPSRWTIAVEKDNGIVESIRAESIAAPSD